MPSKTNMTSPDDDHVQFGDVDTFKNIDGMNTGDAEFVSGYAGRILINPGDGGFGSAYIEPDED